MTSTPADLHDDPETVEKMRQGFSGGTGMTDEPLVARRLRQIAEELRRIVAELRDGEDPDVLASELDECADALDAIREGVKP